MQDQPMDSGRLVALPRDVVIARCEQRDVAVSDELAVDEHEEMRAQGNVVDLRARRATRIGALDEVEVAAVITARYALSTLDACLPGLAGVAELRDGLDALLDAQRDLRGLNR